MGSAMASVKKQKDNLQEIKMLGAHTINEEIDKYRRIRDDKTTSSEMKKGMQQIIDILTATLPTEKVEQTPSAPQKPYEPHETYEHSYHKDNCSMGGESQSSAMSIEDVEENYRLQVFERYRKEGLTLEESWKRWLEKVKKKLAEEQEEKIQRERDRYEANRNQTESPTSSEKEMKNLRKSALTPTPTEVRDKNLAKVVRVKRLYHKKIGRVDRGSVEDNYCYYKYNNTFSDSEEEYKTKKPIKEKTKYHKKQNSHKKNIQWLERLALEGISDIGLKLTVKEVTEKLERRL